MKKRLLLLMAVGIILSLVILSLLPVPKLPENELTVVKGTVSDIFEAGEMDIVFTLKENGVQYYINRGIEQGLSIEKLKEDLIMQKVTIKYPEYWTPLKFTNTHHLSKLIFEGQVIYTEVSSDLVTKSSANRSF